MSFKKITGQIHLWLGLITGLVVLIVSVTGCIYVFEQEIFGAVHKNLLNIQPQQTATLPVAGLKERAQQAMGADHPITAIRIFREPHRTWQFTSYKRNEKALTYFGNVQYWQTVYINPYTGAVAGKLNYKYEFFQLIKFLHWSLWLSNPIGQPIVGWSTLVFVLLLITGLVLWWPKNKRAIKQAFTVKWKARWRRVNYDLHNSIGFYTTIPALIIALTGMVWSFKWFMGLVYLTASGTSTPPPVLKAASVPAAVAQTTRGPMDKALGAMMERYPGAYAYFMNVPVAKDAVIWGRIQELKGKYYRSSEMLFDQYNGRLLKTRLYEERNRGEKLIYMNYDIHVGAILGLPGKILAFIASLVCASLPVTGFLVWWGKRNKKPVRAAKPRKQVLAVTE